MSRYILLLIFLVTCSYAPPETQKNCVVVDTDSSFDDVRAVAWLIQKEGVDFIIFTEGVTLPKQGASLFYHFFTDSGLPRKKWPKFILGKSINKTIDQNWQKIRARDARLNNFYQTQPELPKQAKLHAVSEISRSCPRSKLYILGPTTNAQYYLKGLNLGPQKVSFMGRLNNKDFNCWYDIPSCHSTLSRFGKNMKKVFIPDRDHLDQYYSYSNLDVDKLNDQGMPGLLKKAFLADPRSWQNHSTLMWDDITVMIPFYPEWFESRNDFWIPKARAAKFKETWLKDLNH